MLSLKRINEEIEKREKSDRLTNSVCQELSWLYTVRDHLESKCVRNNDTAYPRVKTQSLDIDMNSSEKKVVQPTRSQSVGYSDLSHPASEKPDQYGESGFLIAVSGKDQTAAWKVMDELMETLRVVNRRAYDSVMRKLDRL